MWWYGMVWYGMVYCGVVTVTKSDNISMCFLGVRGGVEGW